MMKKLLFVFFLLAFINMEAQQNLSIEKADIRRGQTQRSIENDTLKNANPNKSAKLIVPVAIDKGLRQGMNNGAMADTLKRANLKKLADELVNTVDDQNDSLKPSAKVEVRGWDPKEKSTISKTGIKENIDSKENMKTETGVINSGETVDIKKNKIDVIKGTANPSNERGRGVIKNIFPPSNSLFTSTVEVENFTWELIGADIQNAVYVITITRIGNNQQPQQTYTATTSNSEISAKNVAKFKAGKALADTVKRTGNQNQGENGEYQWTVMETTTGISSNTSFFTISEK